MPGTDDFTPIVAGAAVAPCPLKTAEKKKEVHWIEIELVGEDGGPIPEEEYEIRLPDGAVVRGYLDEHGWARVDGIEQAGQCDISFPRLDREAWKRQGGPFQARAEGQQTR